MKLNKLNVLKISLTENSRRISEKFAVAIVAVAIDADVPAVVVRTRNVPLSFQIKKLPFTDHKMVLNGDKKKFRI